MPSNGMRPVHPGEILRCEYLSHRKILAQDLGLDAREFDELINERRDVTPSLAAGLARALGTSSELWLNLQVNYNRRLPHQRFASLGDATEDTPKGEPSPDFVKSIPTR